jgi:protoporphyrinogen oxidase
MKGKEFMRNGKSLVCVWLHEAFAETLLNEPDEHVFARVAEEFIKVCPWFDSVEQLKAFEIQRWFEAMPKFYPGFLRIVKRFLEKGQGDQKVYFTGDYLNSPWTEGALRCGQRVAREVNVRLA